MNKVESGNFYFNTVAGIRFGWESVLSSVEEIRRILGPRVLLISDPGLSQIGLYTPLVDNLTKIGTEVRVFDKVQQDPTLENLELAIESGIGFLATGIVGFGGGAPMDVAKLASLVLGSDEKIHSLWGVNKVKGPRLPLILVPTTAGTGSEVTPVSIMTVDNTEKRGVSSQVIIPDLAVLDPSLTMGLPSKITATTGIDAMVHAIEAYTSSSTNNNVISATLAIQALKLLGSSILAAANDGRSEKRARENMLLGSMLAGISFANSPVAGVHALAYPLGVKYKVSHGLSNALLLPHVLKFNMQLADTKDLYAKLAGIIFPHLKDIKDPKEQANRLSDEFIQLSKKLNLPTRLQEIDIPKDALTEMSTDAMKQDRLLVNNPKKISLRDAEEIYKAAW